MPRFAVSTPGWLHAKPGRIGGRLEDRAEVLVGSADRLRAVLMLAAVLSLTSADMATVGAMATQLKVAFGVDNTQIGLLVTASSGIGVLTVLPLGSLADRVNRVNLLVVSIVVWSVAMIGCALAQTYGQLLVVRLFLGAAIASGGPVVASLTGDLFAPAERGRIYGMILAGELLGAGFGFVFCGELAALSSWRVPFVALAVPGFALAWAFRRYLPEPRRAGRGRLPVTTGTDVEASDSGGRQQDAATGRGSGPDSSDTELVREVSREDVEVQESLVLHRNPRSRSLWWAVRYALSIRTNLVLILASSLGYFFFSGVRTFGIAFAKGRFDLGQLSASLVLLMIGAGALSGILLAGRVSDALIRRHHVTARPATGAACYLLAAALFLPALLTTSLLTAVVLLFLAAAFIGGANPPLDAARLDIMPAALWGRAEAVRTTLRTALEAVAPLLFGYVSTRLGGSGGGLGHPDSTSPIGLDHTFLVMLVPLIAAGLLLLLRGSRTYPRDVATAVRSDELIGRTG